MADEREELPPPDNEGIPEGDTAGQDDSDSNIPLIVLGKGDGTRILRPQEYEENQRKLREEQQQEQPQASEEAPELQFQEQPQAPARPSPEQPQPASSRGGLVGGFVAGLLIGAVATFAVLTYVFPPKGAPATAEAPPPPPPAVSTAALDNAKTEIAKLKARIAELEKAGTQQAGTTAELDKAKEELAKEKARADALQAHNTKLMETVRTVRSVFESVNVKGKRDTVFGPDGATKDKE